jgi:hypothetical protein
VFFLLPIGRQYVGVKALVIDVDPPVLDGGPRLGDTVWLQPGHCDPTINLYDAFLVVERDGSWAHWPIDARRKHTATERCR